MNEEDAWIALDHKKYDLALKIWSELIQQESNIQRKNILEMHSCYALVELEQFDKAREVLLKLFEQKKEHKYLHQLCMVERLAKKYEQALRYLEQEEVLISKDDWCALATNRYEFAKIYELKLNMKLAFDFAQECLNYSKRCDDLVMNACAFRILGDIFSHANINKALVYYKQSKELFFKAKDLIAVEEIDEKISHLK